MLMGQYNRSLSCSWCCNRDTKSNPQKFTRTTETPLIIALRTSKYFKHGTVKPINRIRCSFWQNVHEKNYGIFENFNGLWTCQTVHHHCHLFGLNRVSFCQDLLHFTLGPLAVKLIVTALMPSLLFRCFLLFLPHLRGLAQEKRSENCVRFGTGGPSLCIHYCREI